MLEKDGPFKRFLTIIKQINARQGVDIKALSKEFGVSIRTMQRDLVNITRFFDIEIIKAKDGLYYASRNIHEDGRLSFADIKFFAHRSGLDGLYPFFDEFMIVDVLNPKLDSFEVKANSREDASKGQKLFENLNDAILNKLEVKFTYNSKERTIKPYKLINTNGVWYLLGDESHKLKHFTLSKIANFKESDVEFVPSRIFIDKIAKNDLKWLNTETKTAQLLILPKARVYFERKKAFENFKVIKDDKNGILIETKYAFDDELLNVVRAWIPYIKVIEPIELRDKLKEGLEKYLKDM